ncbi:unnamed protein product [Strongylus vulgaris]|uniref:Uncharacterized protein n=1 Tax=Strongylus vulgaris TaxID=40348 RepID=A0A3P7IBI0_STRVU|nr:unnamed protein product [Strongylus vulgaris]
MKQEDDEISSSSSSSGSDSENLSDVLKSEASSEGVAAEGGNASYDSDESFEVVPQKRARGSGSGKQRTSAGSSTKSRASNGSGTTRKSAKASAVPALPRASKPIKPWQRTGEPVVEGDVVVPPRPLRKGEKKMLKFRCAVTMFATLNSIVLNAKILENTS